MEKLGDPALRVLRLAGFALGGLIVVVSIFGDALGISAGQGFSRNQLFIAAGGGGIVLASALGRRFPRTWRSLGLFLLNLLVAALFVEILSLIVIKLWNPHELAITARKEREADLLRNEVTTVPGHYVSYLVWQADQNRQGCETTDSLGHRTTPGAVPDTSAFRVFTFGGSAMWGAGVADSCTIAAYLQAVLPDMLGHPVEVTNFGQMSWVSTQELICLLFQLRDGNVPDLVVFFDGFNDVWSSYQIGRAGEHQNLPQITERVEGRDILRWQETLLSQLFYRTNTGQLIRLVRTSGTLRQAPLELITYRAIGTDPQILAESTYTVCTRNLRAASALGSEYGFDCLFYWQPTIWCGEKPRTAWEDSIWTGGSEAFQAGGDPDWKELLCRTEALVASEAGSIHGYQDLSGVFDSTSAEMYSDYSGCHLNPQGNELVAEIIASRIRETESGLQQAEAGSTR